jgi:hypothetical protein
MAEPWKIKWFVCRADSDDVAYAKTEGRKLKIGDELWRVPLSIGPIEINHSHWAGEHLTCEPEEARMAANAPIMLAICKEFIRRVDAGEIHSVKTYAAMKKIIKTIEEGE